MKNIQRLTAKELMGKSIHIRRADDFCDIGLHWHSYCELIYFVKGSAQSIINGKGVELEADTLYMLTPMDFHHTFKTREDKAEYINVSFTEDILDEPLRKKLTGPYYIPHADEKMCAILELLSYKDISHKEAQHFINGLLYRVMTDTNQLDLSSGTIANKTIRSAIRYISDNFQKPLTLKDISSYLHLAPGYFSELFSGTCGCTFKEYLTDYRLSYACRLLNSTDKTVTDICYSCGFSNLSNFLRAFKNHVGKTPTQYRINYERQI